MTFQAVAGAVFSARTWDRLPSGVLSLESGSSIDFSHLNSIEPLSLKMDILRVISSSIQVSLGVHSHFNCR